MAATSPPHDYLAEALVEQRAEYGDEDCVVLLSGKIDITRPEIDVLWRRTEGERRQHEGTDPMLLRCSL